MNKENKSKQKEKVLTDSTILSEWPFVSIIMPMYNEEEYIGRCLESILELDYPGKRIEVLIADGMSTDNSREIVVQYAQKKPYLKLLDNKKRFIAAGLNVGLAAAQGEIIVRMDCHATFAKDYVKQCVFHLQNTEAANVGGQTKAIQEGYIGAAIAAAGIHPFGVGGAGFRVSEQEEWVDTIFPGAWYKMDLDYLGGFNEDWLVNEDYELNYRLRAAGGKILLSPKIQCNYYVRSSLSKLFKQYFRYGFWRIKTFKEHPGILSWSQVLPPLFILALVVPLVFIPIYWPVALITPGIYLSATVIASVHSASRRGWHLLPILPLVFSIIHSAAGLGRWVGLFYFGLPRFSLLIKEIKRVSISPVEAKLPSMINRGESLTQNKV